MNSKFPQFATRSELKRIVWLTRTLTGQRVGQAICNRYELPMELANQLWEDADRESVITKLWNYFIKPDYQN